MPRKQSTSEYTTFLDYEYPFEFHNGVQYYEYNGRIYRKVAYKEYVFVCRTYDWGEWIKTH